MHCQRKLSIKVPTFYEINLFSDNQSISLKGQYDKRFMDLEFNKNEDSMRLLVSSLDRKLEQVFLGGGEKRIAKLHAEGKLTARERIEYLLDTNKPQIEIGALVGDGMYEEHGGCPSGGVVVVIGYIKNRQCIVVANDATEKIAEII